MIFGMRIFNPWLIRYFSAIERQQTLKCRHPLLLAIAKSSGYPVRFMDAV
jgi:hypothetical protein